MIRHAIDRLLVKWGLNRSRITAELLRTIGNDESLLYEAIAQNVNKNDRALYNLLHCARLLNRAAGALGETFQGRSVLEIGTSREPGLPLIMLLQGCSHYYASNILTLENRLPAAYIDLIRLMMCGMLQDAPVTVDEVVDWVPPQGGRAGERIGRLRDQLFHDLSPTSAENLELPDESMDVIFSLAVLEHVHRPQAVIDNIHRMTRPGGWGLHVIDLRDHRDFDRPLEFLKQDERSYRASRPNGENRWRASDFLEAFGTAGFHIEDVELVDGQVNLNAERNCDTARDIIDPVRRPKTLDDCEPWVTEQQRATFEPPFNERSLQDLSVLSLSVAYRKPV